MSVPLAEALADVELEVGRTYRCQVRGQRVELRVLPATEAPTATRNYTLPEIDPDDIRLEPWCELPSPKPVSRSVSRLVSSLPFDIPDIPADEESE